MSPIERNAKDFWTGVIYIVVGVAAIVIGRDYGMGTAMKMGPAYFPVILSSLLIVIGAISVIRAFLKPGTPIGRVAWKGLALIVAATVLFGVVVRGAGTAIALPAMIVVSAYASRRFRWKWALALAAGVSVFCILIFQVGLGVPLPVLGAWFGE